MKSRLIRFSGKFYIVKLENMSWCVQLHKVLFTNLGIIISKFVHLTNCVCASIKMDMLHTDVPFIDYYTVILCVCNW